MDPILGYREFLLVDYKRLQYKNTFSCMIIKLKKPQNICHIIMPDDKICDINIFAIKVMFKVNNRK